MKIENFFSKEHVFFIKSDEKYHVIREILDRLVDLKEIDSAERFYAQIMHRESLENTGIGKGLAIPHVRTEAVEKLITVFAVSKSDIEYHSYDKVPVRYILLNIVPIEESTKYLYLIGMVSWLFMDPTRKRSLDQSETKAQIYSALSKNIKIYFDTISNKRISEMDTIDNMSGIPLFNLDLLIRLDHLYKLLDKGEKSPKITLKIDELRKMVDRKSLAYYEKMRKRSLNPFAILEKNACMGCHMNIAPYYLAQIKESNDIAVCNHCGRFLIII
jgi:mannitol/fructose-specific phosphotransferase system IIA component (Ntr-type)